MNFEKYRENNIDLSDTRKKKAKIDFKSFAEFKNTKKIEKTWFYEDFIVVKSAFSRARTLVTMEVSIAYRIKDFFEKNIFFFHSLISF